MEALGLTQQLTQPKHKKGNILDLVGIHRTRLKNYNHWIQNKHSTIRPLLNHQRFQHQEEQAKIVTKTIRDTTKLSPIHEIEVYPRPIFKPKDTIDQACNHFKEESLKMLDAVAPQKVIKTTEKL